MKPITLVIPAAGLGSRFRNVGIETTKPLIPILGRPMLEWVIGNFPLIEGDRIVVIGQKADRLGSNLPLTDLRKFIDVSFIEIDGITDGPATTVSFALDSIPEDNPVIVANSDQYVSASLVEYVRRTRNPESDGFILTMLAEGNKWSYVGRNTNGAVDRVREKEEISNEATVGIYSWSTASLCRKVIQMQRELGEKVNNEFYVAPTYNFLLGLGLKIDTLNIGSHGGNVHGLGTPEDLQIFLNDPRLSEFEAEVIKNLRI